MNRRVCEHCHQQFKTDTGYGWHVERVHLSGSTKAMDHVTVDPRGFVPCPDCGKSAGVSTSQTTREAFVQVVCERCTTRIVLVREGHWGQIVLDLMKPYPVKTETEMTPFIAWDCDMANAELVSRSAWPDDLPPFQNVQSGLFQWFCSRGAGHGPFASRG
jgi:predicted RNA-binding Zn-ribbon protein involved in translation (DUF1610 family)